MDHGSQHRTLRSTLTASRVNHVNLVGNSPAFLRVLALIKKVAACNATLLIHGETGTGKELVARAVHYSSVRSDQPFIPINCGAIADSLIESDLFGAERGAFTDAREARTGIIAQAAGGTLLLDEVEVMSPKAQVVMLRYLEDREYRPVVGRSRHVAERITAASNFQAAKARAIAQFEKSYHAPLLRQTDGKVSLAADLSGKERSALGKLIKKYGLARSEFKRFPKSP